MHEFRVTKIVLDVNVISAPKGLLATHPVEISSVVIPLDTDSDDTIRTTSSHLNMQWNIQVPDLLLP